jgi:hypothetical protein
LEFKWFDTAAMLSPQCKINVHGEITSFQMTEKLQEEDAGSHNYLRAAGVDTKCSKQGCIGHLWAEVSHKYIVMPWYKKRNTVIKRGSGRKPSCSKCAAITVKGQKRVPVVSSLCPLAYAQLTLIGCPNLYNITNLNIMTRQHNSFHIDSSEYSYGWQFTGSFSEYIAGQQLLRNDNYLEREKH